VSVGTTPGTAVRPDWASPSFASPVPCSLPRTDEGGGEVVVILRAADDAERSMAVAEEGRNDRAPTAASAASGPQIENLATAPITPAAQRHSAPVEDSPPRGILM
jgi:hypothetical protein